MSKQRYKNECKHKTMLKKITNEKNNPKTSLLYVLVPLGITYDPVAT